MQSNKLGITDEAQFLRKEEELTKKKAVELFEKNMLDKFRAGHHDSVIKIHDYLFKEVYDFAGKLRTTDITSLNIQYTPAANLKAKLEEISKMPQKTFDEIVAKYIQMHIAQPFAEGNGRVNRLWLDVMCKKELKKVVNWQDIEKDAYLSAMEMCAIDGTALKTIIEAALIDNNKDREIFVKNIDAIFNFDGYNTYRTRVLG